MTLYLVLYYCFILVLQSLICTVLITRISRINPEDYRSRSLINLQYGILLWAAYDFIISTGSLLLPGETAFLLYRILSFMFLTFAPLATIVIVSLTKQLSRRLQMYIFLPFLLLYTLVLLFPGFVSAAMFHIEGGYEGQSGPWNAMFRLVSIGMPVMFLIKLILHAAENGDSVIRKGQIILGSGALLFITGMGFSQLIVKSIWAQAPWLANLCTLFINIAAFIALRYYSRVLSTRSMFETIVRTSPSGISRIQQGKIIWSNRSMEKILNRYDIQDLMLDELKISGESRIQNQKNILREIENGLWNDEIIKIENIESHPVFCLVNSSPLNDEITTSDNLLILTDITEQIQIKKELGQANRALTTLVNKDSLTGIYNRRMFNEALESERKRNSRSSSPLCLIIFDVDYFKKYNDTYGHQAGDDCLIRLTEAVTGQIKRECDVFCRIGGEEFAVILPDTDLKGAAEVAEILRRCIETLRIPHRKSDISDWVTISLGAAEINCSGSLNSDDLYHKADQALYKAKNNGRNRVSFLK